MKLRYINPANIKQLIPAWAIDPMLLARHMEEMLRQHFGRKNPLVWHKKLPFWIDFSYAEDKGGWRGRIAGPTTQEEEAGCGKLTLDHSEWAITVPLNECLKGASPIEGNHALYAHTVMTDTPLTYIGITKQRWFDRLSQHQSRSRCGSPYLFHRALRDHAEIKIVHNVLFSPLSHDNAMNFEEEFVEKATLYPLGLNMIPGGFAGIRYLGSLGIIANNYEARNLALENLAAQENISGKPNPLCAARWASDQEFVNRVICGHSGRLTIEQVRTVRMFAASGKIVSDISNITGISTKKIKNVVSGNRYSRAL